MNEVKFIVTAQTAQAQADVREFGRVWGLTVTQAAAASQNANQAISPAATQSAAAVASLSRTSQATTASVRALTQAATLIGFQTFPTFTGTALTAASTMRALSQASRAFSLSLGPASAAVVAVTAVVATGTTAWSAYRAEMQAIEAEARRHEQEMFSVARMTDLAAAAYQRGSMSAEEYLRVIGLLMKATLEGDSAALGQARTALRPFIVSPDDLKEIDAGFKKLADLTQTLVKENLRGEEQQREAAQQTFRERTRLVEQYRDLLESMRGQLTPEQARSFEQTINVAAVQAEAAYKKTLADIDEAEREKQRKWALEQQRLQMEADEHVLSAAQRERDALEHIRALRASMHTATLDGLAAEHAAIDERYDREIARINELTNITDEQRARNKAITDELNAARDAEKTRAVKTQAEIDEEKEAEIRRKRVQGVKDMFGDMATTAHAFGAKGFAAYKALATAQALIDIPASAIAAYRSVVGIPYIGPVLAVAAAGAAIAAGTSQAAAIQAQTYAGYAQGGVFSGDGLVRGPGTSTSDSINARLSDGEGVLNARAMTVLGVPALHALNSGQLAALPQPASRAAASAPIGSFRTEQENRTLIFFDKAQYEDAAWDATYKNKTTDLVREMLRHYHR